MNISKRIAVVAATVAGATLALGGVSMAASPAPVLDAKPSVAQAKHSTTVKKAIDLTAAEKAGTAKKAKKADKKVAEVSKASTVKKAAKTGNAKTAMKVKPVG
ncbi:hypothetical protein ABT160_13835 [Streptomyces sp. NPDC001941]|uniref:hypothetical protein n=1 Tax=Streptomyces sp. NPDC001941 TaxID=3154659 RepID=UPI0033337EA7